MPYSWIAFYGPENFLKEVAPGRPPVMLHVGGEEVRLTSIQLYDHQGRAFIEQVFTPRQHPLCDRFAVASDRDMVLSCHLLGWSEPWDDRGLGVAVRHCAHIVEDGRISMTTNPVSRNPLAQLRRRHRLADMLPFTWAAIYDDGTPVLYQYDPLTGIEVPGERIDRSRLLALVLSGPDGTPWIKQYFAPGQRLIYRRRFAQVVGGRDPSPTIMLGWSWPDGPDHVTFVFPETGVAVMSGIDDNHPIFYGIDPVPADKQLVGIGGIPG
jgi:hypothetical protein